MQSSPQNSALFTHASMAIIVADSTGIIKSTNPFGLKRFGYKSEESLVRPVEKLIPKRFHRHHVHKRQGYMENPKSRPMGLGMDLFAIKKDGCEFPLEVSLGNYKNSGDSDVIVYINDITVRKSAERQLQEFYDGLEATVEGRTKDLKIS